MTRNFYQEDKYIAVEGIERATEVAAALLRNDYEVFIELDDCNIYCVHFSERKGRFSESGFYRLSEDDLETLYSSRPNEQDDEDY